MADLKISQLPRVTSTTAVDLYPLVQAGTTSAIQFSDLIVSVGSNLSHHNLQQLATFDDHPQYLPVNGTRPMLADLPMGGFDIDNANVITANIVNVNNIALGDASSKAANTNFVDQTAIAMAIIFG